MLKHFYYKKKDSTVSERYAHPLGISNEKLLAVDLTEFDAAERGEYENLLNQIHAQYIQAIKEVGLGAQFRSFFLTEIVDVQRE